jgi:3',5'-cyclic AMP phosphodiesterase CpdA
MFRLAQVSDPHFQSFRLSSLRDLLGKRMLGGLNLLLMRRRKHSMTLLQGVLDDLRGRPVDHLAITGDLCNIALESEWSAALRWISSTGLPADRVTVIPGNHDAYVPQVTENGVFERMFAAYQTADLRLEGATYPFVRFRGDLALVCVSTGVPTGDLGAWGRVGPAQLARLESLLAAPEVRSRRRVMLIHHPPQVNRDGEDLNLRDRDALQALLLRAGSDLVMHGHDHRDFFKELPGPDGTRIPVVGVGSASYVGPPDRCSRYHVYEFEGAAIEVVTYAHDEASGRFVEYRRKKLAG